MSHIFSCTEYSKWPGRANAIDNTRGTTKLTTFFAVEIFYSPISVLQTQWVLNKHCWLL